MQVSCAQAIVVSEEVQAALQKNQPVVALESTIISHGMPYPQNFKTALEVEAVVRANGAFPATVALLAGVPHVGLSESQLHDIAQKGLKVQKTSRRDLAYVMTRRLDGSTTVSATMLLAARAGISVFVTGGIGISSNNTYRTLQMLPILTHGSHLFGSSLLWCRCWWCAQGR